MARYDLTRPIRNPSEWEAFNSLFQIINNLNLI
jgi:hypothetical protein